MVSVSRLGGLHHNSKMHSKACGPIVDAFNSPYNFAQLADWNMICLMKLANKNHVKCPFKFQYVS